MLAIFESHRVDITQRQVDFDSEHNRVMFSKDPEGHWAPEACHCFGAVVSIDLDQAQLPATGESNSMTRQRPGCQWFGMACGVAMDTPISEEHVVISGSTADLSLPFIVFLLVDILRKLLGQSLGKLWANSGQSEQTVRAK